MKKKTFNLLFIIISGALLLIILEFDLLEKYGGLSLIPIMLAYFLGQFSERKFKN